MENLSKKMEENNSDSIKLIITNTTNEEKEVNLFGCSKNLLKPNFGNDEEVEIKSAHSGIDYAFVLLETGFKNINIELIRLKSENKDQVKETVNIHGRTIDGMRMSGPLNGMLVKDENSEDFTGVYSADIKAQIGMDSTIDLTFNIKPKTKLTFVVFYQRMN